MTEDLAPPVLSPLLTMTNDNDVTLLHASRSAVAVELDAQRATVARLTAELSHVDAVLSRRDALDGATHRIDKILLAIKIAASNDPKGEVARLTAENAVLKSANLAWALGVETDSDRLVKQAESDAATLRAALTQLAEKWREESGTLPSECADDLLAALMEEKSE